MIIYTISKQLIEWTKCKNFQIDFLFKYVTDEINEFKINSYNITYNLSKF